VLDEGILVDPAAASLDFVGAGVVASGGAGAVTVTISGGGGGAPVGATYVTLSLDPGLTAERVLTAGTGISIVDGGANGPVTLAVDATWAEILVNGASSGGTSPVISTGDSLLGQTDLILTPGGGGGDNVIIDGLTWPSVDGASGEAIITNGAGVLSFGAPTPALHAPTHIHLGTDEIDGDKLDIDFVPTNYVRTITGPFTTSVEELTSHLAGIDTVLANVADKTFIAGEALTAGDLVALNTSGEAIRADSSIAAANWEVIGVANQTVAAAAPVLVTTRSGDCPIVRFTAAPAGALNGSLVFLSTTSGLATPTPPVAVGNTIFTIGTLQGADGATATPVVVFRPQYIAQRR